MSIENNFNFEIIWFPSDSYPEQEFDKQVLYIESYYHEEINDIITRNIEEIEKMFSKFGLTFIFMPKVLQREDIKEFIVYNNPNENCEPKNISLKDITQVVTRSILSSSRNTAFVNVEKLNLPYSPGLLMRGAKAEYYQYFVAIMFDTTAISKLMQQLALFANTLSNKEQLPPCDCFFRYQPLCDNSDYPLDVQGLIDEVKERVALLQSKGYINVLIDALFEDISLSKIVITSNGEIFLPDFGIEIKIPPLVKALYILYLLHPRGIKFEELYKHEQLLMNIYLTISNRVDYDTMLKSVQDLTDIKSNSYHEKCSRIKNVLLYSFSDVIARNYYISSAYEQGPKRIPISVYKDKIQISSEFLKSIGLKI